MAMMMRVRMRMYDDKDEDWKEVPHAQALRTAWLISYCFAIIVRLWYCFRVAGGKFVGKR